MKCFLIFMVIFGLLGCTSPQNVPSFVLSPTLTPLSIIAKMAVEQENSCEDPIQDAKTLTMTESIADTLSYPYVLTMGILRIAASMSVGVVMAFAGYKPQEINAILDKWLPITWSGPDPNKVDYKKVKLVNGCLNKQKAP